MLAVLVPHCPQLARFRARKQSVKPACQKLVLERSRVRRTGRPNRTMTFMRLPVLNTVRALPARRAVNLFRRARRLFSSCPTSLALPLVLCSPKLRKLSSMPSCRSAPSYSPSGRQWGAGNNFLTFVDQLGVSSPQSPASRLSFGDLANASASSCSMGLAARSVEITSFSSLDGEFSFASPAAPCVSHEAAPTDTEGAACLDNVVLPESQPVAKEHGKLNGPNLQILPGVISSSLLVILGSAPDVSGLAGNGTEGAALTALANFSPLTVGQCLASHNLPKGIHVENAPPLTDDTSPVRAAPVGVLTAIAEAAANRAAISAAVKPAISSSSTAAVANNSSTSTLKAEHFLASVTSQMQRGDSLPAAVRMLSTHLTETEIKNVMQGLQDLNEEAQDLAVCLAQPPEMTEPDAEVDIRSVMNSLRSKASIAQVVLTGNRPLPQRSQGRRSLEAPPCDSGVVVV